MQWSSLQQALAAGKTFDTIATDAAPSTLVQILANVKRTQGLNGNDQNLLNYLVLMNDQKAAFGISNNIVGTYRYYSCSHPSPEHQGTTNLALVSGAASPAPTPAPLDAPAEVTGFNPQPPAPTTAPVAAATGGGTATGGDSSSLATLPPGDKEAFYSQVLIGAGLPNTPNNRAFLAAWATQEGGKGGSRALYNPLNTTWKKPGATAFNYNNGNPVKNYSTFEDGVSATVKTLNQSYYTSIRTAMQIGNKIGRAHV